MFHTPKKEEEKVGVSQVLTTKTCIQHVQVVFPLSKKACKLDFKRMRRKINTTGDTWFVCIRTSKKLKIDNMNCGLNSLKRDLDFVKFQHDIGNMDTEYSGMLTFYGNILEIVILGWPPNLPIPDSSTLCNHLWIRQSHCTWVTIIILAMTTYFFSPEHNHN